MKTTWNIKNVKKTTKDDEYTELTLKDYRGVFVFKIDNGRHLLEDLDKVINYKGL